MPASFQSTPKLDKRVKNDIKSRVLKHLREILNDVPKMGGGDPFNWRALKLYCVQGGALTLYEANRLMGADGNSNYWPTMLVPSQAPKAFTTAIEEGYNNGRFFKAGWNSSYFGGFGCRLLRWRNC